MLIAICGDNHFSKSSSIVRGNGEKFSLRLENQIRSINWFENLAFSSADMVVYLGDFFDKSTLDSEELTALNYINWEPNLPHYMLVGNHEMGHNNLVYSSAHLFNLCKNLKVIDKVSFIDLSEELELCFLPYILEDNRLPLEEYLKDRSKRNRIILSHNDIKGIQMGPIESPIGFTIDEIERNCDLFINGHLHNGSKVTSKIINCGNLTGQNFSEDAFKYDHVALILDTDTLKVEVYENPYALNFYKLGKVDSNSLSKFMLRPNSVVTASTSSDEMLEVRKLVEENPNIIASRITFNMEETSSNNFEDEKLLEAISSSNYLETFKNYMLEDPLLFGEAERVKSIVYEVIA